MITVPPTLLPILTQLRSLLPKLRREFPLGRVAVFGSMARGDSHPGSDLDLLVDVEPSIGLGFVTLADRLELELGRKVDLVSKRAVKPTLLRQIEAEMIDVET